MAKSTLADTLELIVQHLITRYRQEGFLPRINWEPIAEELRIVVREEDEEKRQREYSRIHHDRLSHLSQQINTSHLDDLSWEDTEDDPTMAAKQSNPTILTPVGTLSFANTLFEKRPATEGAEPMFSCNVVFSPEDQKSEAYKALKQAIKDAADKFFGPNKYPKNMRWPVRDGAEKEGQYEGYTSGDTFITVKTKSQPGVIGPRKEDVTADMVWSGQRARVALRPYAYSKAGNNGVGLSLESVQIAKFECPRMDGRAADPRKIFDDLEGGDEIEQEMADDEIPF